MGAGAHYLETDVQATLDGIVVAFHDDTVDDATDGSGAISAMTWQQVSELQVRASMPGAPQRIPRLADLLDAFPQSSFNLDIKTPDVIEPLARLLTDRHATGDDVLARICIASFSDRRRRAVLRRLPRAVCSSAGTRTVLAFWLGTRLPRPVSGVLARWVARDVDVFQVPVRHGPATIVDTRFVQAAHRSGRHVHVWTVNDERTMRELLALDVDGLISDRTDVALASIAADARARSAAPPVDQ